MVSKTPLASEVKESSVYQTASTQPQDTSLHRVANGIGHLYYSNFISPGANSTQNTANEIYLNNMSPLNEFTLQSLPTTTLRHFLCMTRNGVIVIAKKRPIDYFVRILLANDGNLEKGNI